MFFPGNAMRTEAIRRHLLKKQQAAVRPDRDRKLRLEKSTALAMEGCQR